MRRTANVAAAICLLAALRAQPAPATPGAEGFPAGRALYTGLATVANVVPLVSTLYAPRCLPGYLLCKATFAGMSLVAAGGQLVLSGGGDLSQTRAILHRGFAGDWYLTARHTSGDSRGDPLPDPPPRSSHAAGCDRDQPSR